MADRRDDLSPLDRAVSDVLDHINSRMHGLSASWAYPERFREWLRDLGYVVVSAAAAPPADLPAVLSSVDDVARVCSGDGWRLTWSLEPDGLTREWEHDSGVHVRAEQSVTIMAVTVRPTTHGFPRWKGSGPVVHLDVLWLAIQAVRGGEPS